MASNTQYYIWAAPFENAYCEQERRFGRDRGEWGLQVSEDGGNEKEGMLEYSLDRSQDQKEEVEVEGDLL